MISGSAALPDTPSAPVMCSSSDAGQPDDAKVFDQLRGALRLLSASTLCGSRAGELGRKCPELRDLMDGVLKCQLDDQASAQEAWQVLTQFANERD